MRVCFPLPWDLYENRSFLLKPTLIWSQMLKNLDFCLVEQSKGVLKGCLTENNANNSTLKKPNNHLTIFKG